MRTIDGQLLTSVAVPEPTDLPLIPRGSSKVPNPAGIAFDGENIWVTHNAGVRKLRATDGANLGDISTGSGPAAVVFDGAAVWISNFSGDSVTKLRASDGTNLGTFAVGNGPIGLAFDSVNVWVANYLGGTLSRL